MSFHSCEHLASGACTHCRFPMEPRSVKFIGGKKDWLLLFRGRVLKGCETLHDALKQVMKISDKREFQIMSPNGVKMSLEVARMVGV